MTRPKYWLWCLELFFQFLTDQEKHVFPQLSNIRWLVLLIYYLDLAIHRCWKFISLTENTVTILPYHTTTRIAAFLLIFIRYSASWGICISEIFQEIVFVDNLHKGLNFAFERVEDATEGGNLAITLLTNPILNFGMWATLDSISLSSKLGLDYLTLETTKSLRLSIKFTLWEVRVLPIWARWYPREARASWLVRAILIKLLTRGLG